MRYWICGKCGLVHSEKTIKCECGNSALFAYSWVEFPSTEALEEWIGKINKHMGAKLKYAGD